MEARKQVDNHQSQTRWNYLCMVLRVQYLSWMLCYKPWVPTSKYCCVFSYRFHKQAWVSWGIWFDRRTLGCNWSLHNENKAWRHRFWTYMWTILKPLKTNEMAVKHTWDQNWHLWAARMTLFLPKGAEIRETKSCNLSRNKVIVAG